MSLHPRFIDAVRHLHPAAKFFRDVIVEDHGDGPKLAAWNLPGKPPTNKEIEALLSTLDAPPRRLVNKSDILARLHAAGKLAAASKALNADLYRRERWYAPDRPAIYADDPEALALLNAIGADPKVILA